MTSETYIADHTMSLTLPRNYLLAIYLLLGVAALLPLTMVDIPALVDYPNHLARMHVIAQNGTNQLLASNYQVAWSATPNLAMDLILPPLTQIFSVTTLGRLFIALTMISLVTGTLVLHRTLHGSIGLWPMATYLFLYNHLLIMGFLNYLFSIGVALMLFAAWIASDRWAAWIRWTLFPLALAALFFSHIFALGIYGVCVSTYEIARAWPSLRTEWRSLPRRWAVVAWQFLPAAGLVLATMPDSGSGGFIYGPLMSKVRAIWSPTLTYITPTDAGIFLFVVAILVGGLATRRLVLCHAVRFPLVVLTVLAAAMPFWTEGAWGITAFMDLRLPLFIALLLMAGLRPHNISARVAISVICAAAVLMSARLIDTSLEWRKIDGQYAEFRDALQFIEPGASILPAQTQDSPRREGETRFDYLYWHLPVLAVLDRSAFVPTMFTDPAKQPVRAAPARVAMDTDFGAPIKIDLLVDSARGGNMVAGGLGMKPFWRDWPRRYDYVVITHFGTPENPLPDLLTLEHEGSYFSIYRVLNKDGS